MVLLVSKDNMMKNLATLLLLCFCVFVSSAKSAGYINYWAEDWATDRTLDQCIQTADQKRRLDAEWIYCYVTAEKEWNTVLNREYKLLYNSASPVARESLKKSQLAWIYYKDSYFHFVHDYYFRGGTAFRSFASSAEMGFTRNKAIMLIIERKNLEERIYEKFNPEDLGDAWSPDKWTANCLKEQPDTGCYTEAEKKWDAELNKSFKTLYDSITDRDDYYGPPLTAAVVKKELKKSQRAWIHYRDSYNKFLHDYYNHPGEQWHNAEARSKMDLVRFKAKSLLWERESVCLCGKCDGC